LSRSAFPVHLARSLAVAAGLALAASAPAAAKPKLPSRTVQCGEVLTASLRVANNLKDCPADGLVIGAPGITIDLGGHRIDGVLAAGSAGVDNSAGHADVVIQNGFLLQFEDGVRLENASGNTLALLHAEGITEAGIHLIASSGNVLRQNTVRGSDDLGVHFEFASNGNTLADNEITGSGAGGIFVNDSPSANVFLRNTVSANGGYGFEIYGSDSILKGNVAEANQDTGIVLDGAPTNCLVKANRASGNDGSGIQIFGGSGNVLVGNTAHENGIHGIVSDTNAVTLRKNRANGNGFLNGGAGDDVGLGILAPAGATTSGNKAAGNDDPSECQASDLGCHVP
jgi:parallel beta-helix repeat protein